MPCSRAGDGTRAGGGRRGWRRLRRSTRHRGVLEHGADHLDRALQHAAAAAIRPACAAAAARQKAATGGCSQVRLRAAPAAGGEMAAQPQSTPRPANHAPGLGGTAPARGCRTRPGPRPPPAPRCCSRTPAGRHLRDPRLQLETPAPANTHELVPRVAVWDNAPDQTMAPAHMTHGSFEVYSVYSCRRSGGMPPCSTGRQSFRTWRSRAAAE